MARDYAHSIEFYRVIVSYQRKKRPTSYENPEYGDVQTDTLGPYTTASIARGAASAYVGWRNRLVERRVQRLVSVGTITTVVDENGNEEKTLGARLEWRDV